MNQIFHSNQSKGLIPLFFFVCRVREAVCCCCLLLLLLLLYAVCQRLYIVAVGWGRLRLPVVLLYAGDAVGITFPIIGLGK